MSEPSRQGSASAAAHAATRAAFCLAVVLFVLLPAPARAEWLVTPYAALKFSGATNFVDLERGAGDTKVIFGASGGWLGSGFLGVEGEFGYGPSFFTPRAGALGVSSRVMTATVNVLVAAPLGLTRESLRPYLAAGFGMMDVSINDVLDIFDVDRTLPATSVGVGAIGAISERTSLRFDLRYFKSISNEDTGGVGFGSSRLSFWRAAAGVTFRY